MHLSQCWWGGPVCQTSYLERWRKKSCNVLSKLGNACRVGNLLEQWKGAWQVRRDTFCCCSSVISHVWLFVTPWTAAREPPLSSTVSWNWFTFMWANDDAIHPSHPLPPPSPFTFNLSQHQALFQCVGLCIRWPKFGVSSSVTVVPMNIQGWFPFGLTGLISLQFKRVLRVFSSTTVWNLQFFGAQLYLWSSSHIRTWLLEKP